MTDVAQLVTIHNQSNTSVRHRLRPLKLPCAVVSFHWLVYLVKGFVDLEVRGGCLHRSIQALSRMLDLDPWVLAWINADHFQLIVLALAYILRLLPE